MAYNWTVDSTVFNLLLYFWNINNISNKLHSEVTEREKLELCLIFSFLEISLKFTLLEVCFKVYCSCIFPTVHCLFELSLDWALYEIAIEFWRTTRTEYFFNMRLCPNLFSEYVPSKIRQRSSTNCKFLWYL